MAIDNELTSQLRGAQRAGAQFGEPWPSSIESKILNFTAGALPTGAFTLPTGARAFKVFNKTSSYLMLKHGTMPMASSTIGEFIVKAETSELVSYADMTDATPIYSYCMLDPSPTVGSTAANAQYKGGVLCINVIRP